MIKPNSLFRLFWNSLIFFLVIYIAVVMPIRLAFLAQEDIENQKFQVIFDLSADICFIVDILINFIAVEEDVNGELITSMKDIAVRYFKGWFFVDLISSIPVSWIVLYWQKAPNEIQALRFLKLAKMARLYRILTVFKLSRVIKNQKVLEALQRLLTFSPDTSQIFHAFISGMFLLHVIGCLWAVVTVMTIDSERDNWIRDKGLQDADIYSKYISSCYWAVVTISTVGYGDITPTSQLEMITTVILMFVGVSMYSYIMSQLTSIFAQQKSKKEDKTQEKIIKQFV